MFCGYDSREAVGFHVFQQSVIERTSERLQITPLYGEQRDSTNSFGLARFLVPYLCGYKGYAIWADGADMLMRADIAELWDMRETGYAVKVVKHDYKTKHKRKYVGTELEAPNQDYDRKNWSSLILWDCTHNRNRVLEPAFIDRIGTSFLHRFEWLADGYIGDLPPEWNHLVGESAYDPDAKIAHFTLGIPGFEHYASADYSEEWRAVLRNSLKGNHGRI